VVCFAQTKGSLLLPCCGCRHQPDQTIPVRLPQAGSTTTGVPGKYGAMERMVAEVLQPLVDMWEWSSPASGHKVPVVRRQAQSIRTSDWCVSYHM
jgi:hypothetical protein